MSRRISHLAALTAVAVVAATLPSVIVQSAATAATRPACKAAYVANPSGWGNMANGSVKTVTKTLKVKIVRSAKTQTVRVYAPTFTITDLRGSNGTWKVTGRFGAVKTSTGRTTKVTSTFTPGCSVLARGSAPGAFAGLPSQVTTKTVLVATKDRRVGAGGSTGGQYKVRGTLVLKVPAGTPSGTYSIGAKYWIYAYA
jgi:hypothetical protein